MSNVSFPAAHLSSYDVGHRLQVVTVDGAKVTDFLKSIFTFMDPNKREARLWLHFENVQPSGVDMHGGSSLTRGGFEVYPDQMVKRIIK